MNNAAISDHLSMLSKLMDLHGQNSFRSKSYLIAAFQVEKAAQPFSTMSKEEICSYKSIGTSIGNKIIELLETGHIQTLDELINNTPEGVLDMLRIKGLGPKKIAQLWGELGISNLSELELAAVENRLVGVRGFGEKSQIKILESLAFMQQSAGFNLYAHALQQQQILDAYLQKHAKGLHWQWAGEMVRQLDIIQHLQIVIVADEEKIKQLFTALPFTSFEKINNHWVLEAEQFLPLHIYPASSKNFAQIVFELNCDPVFLAALGKDELPCAMMNEQEWFAQKEWAYLPPVLRNTDYFLQKAKEGKSISLIQPEDVKGLIHCHSTWSDGVASLEEMAQACLDRGLEYMVISDHSKSAFYANGLSEDRIRQQHEEIDQLNKKLAPFRIFKSIEADILNDGSLDYDATVLSSFDLVIASVHSNLNMTELKAMQRLSSAIRNKYTRILGHCTGRLLLSRTGYAVDHKELIDLCAKEEVVIEINANPRRLDIDWSYIPYALERGVTLSINPDAHSIAGIDDIRYGVLAAQKGGLTKQANLSSYTLVQFEKFVGAKRN